MRRPLAVLLAALAGCAHPPAPAARTEGGEASGGGRAPSGDVDSSSADDGESSSGAPVRGEAEASGSFVVRGATVIGHGRVDLRIEDGRIVEIGALAASPFDLDARGQFIAPALVDSHVHLAYAFDAPTLAPGGIAAAIERRRDRELNGLRGAVLTISSISSEPGIETVRRRTLGCVGFPPRGRAEHR